jgi:guanylate kinase
MSGYVVAFAGYSGAGKNAIINELRKRLPFLTYIPSVTTRNKRKGETEGFPYFFVSKEKFLELLQQNAFIEYEKIHGNLYGSLKEKYLEAIQNEQIVLVDIGVEGAVSMKKEFGKHAILIFIEPPTIEELKERLVARGELEIQKRLKRIEYESSMKEHFDEIVINDELASAVTECERILQQRIPALREKGK